MKIYELYIRLGRVAFRLSLPGLRFFLRRTRRAYVLITAGDKILVIKNWLGDGKWALPGGGIGHRETAAAAVIRECEEEIGLKLSDKYLKPVDRGVWHTYKLGHRYCIFSAELGEQRIKAWRLEIVELAWVNLDSLNEKNAPAEILTSIRQLPQ